MRRLTLVAATLMAPVLMAGPTASASASLFDNGYSSYWVINVDTGEITAYSSGNWEASYRNSLYTPAANEQVLVNGLVASSVPMAAAQPGVSVIGLQDVNLDSSTAGLAISPAAGSYDATVRVIMEATSNSSADTLQWRINGGPWQSLSIAQTQRSASATLIDNGGHLLEVELLKQGVLQDSAQMLYSISNHDPLGNRRDTDNDGIPDIVEAELGLNALSGDADSDRDGDGWSDIDTYLRCGVLIRADVERTGCTAMDDDDEDGWSNFDEVLRGTRADDPIAVLPADYGASDSETYYQAQQRYRQFPAARRLYEREYHIEQADVPVRLSDLQATTFTGVSLWHTSGLLSSADLTLAGLNSADVAPERLASTAAVALDSQQMPALRVPAASGAFLRAEATSDLHTALTYLPPVGDANWAEFNADASASGDWQSASEWRENLILWLQQTLVMTGTPGWDDTTTLAILMLEQALRDEAGLRQESRLLMLGNRDRPGDWLTQWLADHRARFADASPTTFPGDCFFRGDTFLTARFPDGCGLPVSPFAALLLNLQSSLNTQLAFDSQQFRQWLLDIPMSGETPSVPVSDWLSERLTTAYEARLSGCYISDYELAELQQDADGLADFISRCPEYHTDSDRYNEQLTELNMRQRLRLALIPDGLRALSDDGSLGEYSADADHDGLTNWDELTLFSTVDMPMPWLSDSDADGSDDILDACPADASNTCLGDRRSNAVALEAGEPQVFQRLNGDSTALVAVTLDRPAQSDVCVTYELSTLTGEPQVNDSGEVCFRAGQSIALVSITLPDAGTNDSATLMISLTDIRDTGGSGLFVLGDQRMQEIAFESADVSGRPTAIAGVSTDRANERSIIELQGSDSQAADGGNLTFFWEQLAGPAAVISNTGAANTAMTLPEVQADTLLGFRLTVTDQQGASASADVSMTALPVEDAPLQLSTPVFAFPAGTELTITPAQLQSYLREPDGDAMTFGDATGLPAGMNARRDGDDFVFAMSAAGGSEALLTRSSRDLNLWQDGIAWISMPGNEAHPYGIWGWTPDQGLQRLAEDAVDGFGSLLTRQNSPAVYFDTYDSDNNATLINRIETGTIRSATAPDYNGVWGNAIDADDGLYYCGYGGNWQILNKTTDTFSDSGVVCSNYDTSMVISGRRTCLSAVDTVACSAGDGSQALTAVYSADAAETTSLGRLYQVGDSVLLTRNVQIEENGFLIYYVNLSLLDLNGGATTLGLMPVNSFGLKALPSDNGLIFVGQGIDGNSDKIMAWRWNTGDTALTTLSMDLLAGHLEDVSSLELSDAALFDGQIFLGVTADYYNHSLFMSDLTGNVTAISMASFAGNIRQWNDRLMLSGTDGSGEGLCDWYEFTRDAGLNTQALITQAGCYTTRSLNDAFVFSRYDDTAGGSVYHIYRMGLAHGQYAIQIPVDDGKGNGISMEIRLEVLP